MISVLSLCRYQPPFPALSWCDLVAPGLELLVAARLLGPGPHPSALPPPSPLSPLLSPSPARLLRGHLCVPLGPTLLILDDLKILHLLTSAKTLFVKVTFSDFKDLMWT